LQAAGDGHLVCVLTGRDHGAYINPTIEGTPRNHEMARVGKKTQSQRHHELSAEADAMSHVLHVSTTTATSSVATTHRLNFTKDMLAGSTNSTRNSGNDLEIMPQLERHSSSALRDGFYGRGKTRAAAAEAAPAATAAEHVNLPCLNRNRQPCHPMDEKLETQEKRASLRRDGIQESGPRKNGAGVVPLQTTSWREEEKKEEEEKEEEKEQEKEKQEKEDRKHRQLKLRQQQQEQRQNQEQDHKNRSREPWGWEADCRWQRESRRRNQRHERVIQMVQEMRCTSTSTTTGTTTTTTYVPNSARKKRPRQQQQQQQQQQQPQMMGRNATLDAPPQQEQQHQQPIVHSQGLHVILNHIADIVVAHWELTVRTMSSENQVTQSAFHQLALTIFYHMQQGGLLWRNACVIPPCAYLSKNLPPLDGPVPGDVSSATTSRNSPESANSRTATRPKRGVVRGAGSAKNALQKTLRQGILQHRQMLAAWGDRLPTGWLSKVMQRRLA